MISGSRVARAGFAVLVVAGAAALLVRAFGTIDVRASFAAISHAGRLAPVALAPFLFGMTLDAVGIHMVLRALGHAVPLSRLLPIRIATEALHLTAPAGFLVADTATATLLEAHCGVPLGSGAVLAVGRKWLVMRAHALYIALGAACGAVVLTVVSHRLFGGGWFAGAVAISALVPLALSLALGAGLRGRSVLARLQAVAGNCPWRALGDRVAHWRAGAVAGDGRLARLHAARSFTWLAAGSFFTCWIFESLETAVVLWLVGAPFHVSLAMAVEVGLTLGRSIGNVAPAGLGIQDAGYATLLTAAGISPETAAAFVLLKRAKDVVWIAIGYGLLAGMGRAEGARAVAPRTLAKAQNAPREVLAS
ncbi:MAG: lysylphosphatidylglycerol synthase domain-containing protein [Polyangiaceae bacterium]